MSEIIEIKELIKKRDLKAKEEKERDAYFRGGEFQLNKSIELRDRSTELITKEMSITLGYFNRLIAEIEHLNSMEDVDSETIERYKLELSDNIDEWLDASITYAEKLNTIEGKLVNRYFND